MGRLVSNAGTASRIVREKLQAGLTFVAIRCAELERERLSNQYPPASTVGQNPARRTGTLQGSVRHGFDEGSFRSHAGYLQAPITVPANASGFDDYMNILIASGRLGIDNVLITEREQLKAAFRAGVDSVESF